MAPSRFVPHCPSCEATLQVTRLGCSRCEMQLEGSFEVPPLLRLPPDDIAFVEAFVRSSGSLKEMAKREGKSYPTIRNRLDRIIAALEGAAQSRDAARTQILDAIAAGEIDAAEGLRRLQEVDA